MMGNAMKALLLRDFFSLYLANARLIGEVTVDVGKQDCSAQNCASNVKGCAPTLTTISK